MKTKPFELNALPLQGVTLIEAGAGTGKTYALAGLFLRLLVEKGFTIEQILVVTYTKAATEELKTRIRNRLLAAKKAIGSGESEDAQLADLIHRTQTDNLVLQRIEDALTDFDRAAIFTIHGFCQRILQHHAFETGQLFHAELVQDSRVLVQELVADFWRRHISNAPYELACFALSKLKGPEKLSQVLDYCAYPQVRILTENKKPDLKVIAEWRNEAEQVMAKWTQAKDQILNILTNPVLNARYYGKCELDPQNPPWTYRHIRLAAFSAVLDQWNGKYPLDDRLLKYLRSTSLKKYTKKGHAVPAHPFFDLCEGIFRKQEQMVDQMELYLRYLKTRLLLKARSALDEKKRRRNLISFDDLLLQVHSALSGKQALKLTRAVREQYKAALVDEFQDTDLLQYGIFQRLFHQPPQMLFMIGDPKQAIYSFRGADLFSYLKAADGAPRKNTLAKNWRSTSSLIKAVNTIFENHPAPFGFEKIKFNPAIAARDEPMKKAAPLALWYLTRTEDDAPSKPFNQEEAARMMAVAVAEEIVRLLGRRREKTDPWQIAVLTRTHRQSQMVKQALTRKNVPAVLHSAGSVFLSEEAGSLLRVLRAVADPNDPKKIRAALAEEMFGLDAFQFVQSRESPDHQLERWGRTFYDAHRLWLNQGVHSMFNLLLECAKIKARLLSLPDGERRVTNVLHLVELLHNAENEHRLSPDGLINWLVVQQRSGEDYDEQQLRLESDARAVRIITMHKSKGLQFDIVFCPFTWSGTRLNQDVAVFHDEQHQHRLTLALGPDISAVHQMAALKEILAENLRMLYVALTRAKERCYMAWGRISGSEVSAPAYLFHGKTLSMTHGQWFNSLVQKMKSLTDGRLIHDLQAVAEKSQGSILVQALPKGSEKRYHPETETEVNGTYRIMKRKVRERWRMASFTALTANISEEGPQWTDRDLFSSRESGLPAGPGNHDSLFDFPKGARAGIFFHDLLEHWDHSHQTPSQQASLIRNKLNSHGFEKDWEVEIGRMLDRLSHKEMKASNLAFSLSQVALDQRINEIEFHFPLKRISPDDLRHCFNQYTGQNVGAEMGRQLGRLTFAPIQGFMKGYIDAVVRCQEQFFLIDWKSNHLGNHLEQYHPDQLAVTMLDEFYFLQYHLYTVAVNRWLSQNIGGYQYKSDFGGVLYLFLRGVGDKSSNHGVFYTKPDEGLICALDTMMVENR